MCKSGNNTFSLNDIQKDEIFYLGDFIAKYIHYWILCHITRHSAFYSISLRSLEAWSNQSSLHPINYYCVNFFFTTIPFFISSLKISYDSFTSLFMFPLSMFEIMILQKVLALVTKPFSIVIWKILLAYSKLPLLVNII